MEVFVYLTVILGILVGLAAIRSRFLSFRGQRPSEYQGLGPDLDLRRALDGQNLCEGVVFGPTGRMASRFLATMTGRWTGDTGVVEMRFTFDGGATQTRCWQLSVGETGLFELEADDVIGTGRGQVVGPTAQSIYTIVLPEDAGGHKLQVTDWMYLTEAGTILNRSQFRKSGMLVAELMATIRNNEAAQ